MDWDGIIGDGRRYAALERRERGGRLLSAAFAALSLLAVVAMLAAAAGPWLALDLRGNVQSAAGRTVAARAAGLPAGRRRAMLAAADAYNRRLAASGRVSFGSVDGDDGTASDGEYGSLLDVDGTGLMGRVTVPSIGVSLPVGHGTGAALEDGAGHLHGTSLPVGGGGTHTVLVAHSNVPQGPMFTRLDELRRGDRFHIETLGRVLEYKVESIARVPASTPDGGYARLLAVHGTRDEATLMTCTGNGNSQRLLVTGVRVAAPSSAKAAATESAAEGRPAGALASLATLAVGLPAAAASDVMADAPATRHGVTPRRGRGRLEAAGTHGPHRQGRRHKARHKRRPLE